MISNPLYKVAISSRTHGFAYGRSRRKKLQKLTLAVRLKISCRYRRKVITSDGQDLILVDNVLNVTTLERNKYRKKYRARLLQTLVVHISYHRSIGGLLSVVVPLHRFFSKGFLFASPHPKYASLGRFLWFAIRSVYQCLYRYMIH
ncbi:unnamed protein product [Citrullus colocynthis]|uniref:Uncharacterized protein n=1 Tax=Citrullus colocynthis TaxID=252529 RepID=A0ABP0YL23_9ROSI